MWPMRKSVTGRSPGGHVGHCSKMTSHYISLNSWEKRGIRVFDHSNQNVWQHHSGASPGFSSRGGHIFKIVLDVCSNRWAKREMGGRAPLAPRWRRPWHHCSVFLLSTFDTVTTGALTSTSDCIHEAEGKYIIICINWFQMFVTNTSNSSHSQVFVPSAKQSYKFFAS